MSKFKIYAGLGGGFGGASFQGVYDFNTQEEAVDFAYELAFEEYESYGGAHGLDDWDQVYEDLLEEGIITDNMSPNQVAETVGSNYLEQVEGWLDYYVEEAVGDRFDEDGNELES